jgi:hypothetical protein
MLFQILFFVNLIFVLFLNSVCNAQQTGIVIEDVSVQLVETRPPVGETIIREYKITALLRNTGDIESTNITVKLKEPQPGINASLAMQPESYPLKPNEEKTFVFENWPTSLSGDVLLNISFRPTSPNVLETSENSGFYVYTLHIGNSNTTTSTPGFEVLIVLLAILSLLLIKQIKK